ncbi:hypothetical protein HPB47_024369 [Ixodes persulcatus]|uniref:Uncharacterized protein n=1 Tax=Ixodes persulcatus TaxID=34615 RepID=A0AC60Q4E9_IXOPE|nr:hypothetical protein HPB47_024369 [Ixodes persulcatus]
MTQICSLTATGSSRTRNETVMSEDPPTSSSETYLDSLVSNGTSSSSPKTDAHGKLRRDGTDGKTDRTVLSTEDLDILLKDCSPIKSADEKSSCEYNPSTSSTPCLDAMSNDDSGSSRDEFLEGPKLAKDLGDTISTTSDVIVINFAEDTTTLKEHLDGIVADYKSKAGIDTADSGGNDLNVLKSYAGSSLTESNAPVLKPADVSLVTYVVRRVAAHATSTSSRDEKVVHTSQLKLFRPPYMDPALFPLEGSSPVTSQPDGTSDREAFARTVLSPTPHIPSGEEEPPSFSSSLQDHIQQPRWIDDHEE